MRWFSRARLAMAIVGLACKPTVAADTTAYLDGETGFQFSQYAGKYTATGSTVYFRIAIPSPVTSGTPYDAVIQIVAPSEVGWAGLAWGGKMTGDPLTVAWQNGQSGLMSPRWATQHEYPKGYTGATIEVLKTGTHSNYSHWQVTAKCTGCTSWTSPSGSHNNLNPKGNNRLAFASSRSKPNSPSNPDSTFSIHDVYSYWTHDFSFGGNAQFNSLVARNGGRSVSTAAVAQMAPPREELLPEADGASKDPATRRSKEAWAA